MRDLNAVQDRNLALRQMYRQVQNGDCPRPSACSVRTAEDGTFVNTRSDRYGAAFLNEF